MSEEGDLFGGARSGADPDVDAADGAPRARRLPLVVARTGRSVEFDAPRLAASIERARRAARHEDPGLAAEVADIVAFSLASREGATGD